jgi:hypothetical protein
MAKKSPKPQEIKAEYHLVNSNNSRAQLIFLPPDECALDKGTVVAAGSFEAVKAAANLLAPNNYKIEKCITPTRLIN